MWKVLFALQNLRFGLESINLKLFSCGCISKFVCQFSLVPATIFIFIFCPPTPLKTPHDTAIKIAFICPLLNHLSCIICSQRQAHTNAGQRENGKNGKLGVRGLGKAKSSAALFAQTASATAAAAAAHASLIFSCIFIYSALHFISFQFIPAMEKLFFFISIHIQIYTYIYIVFVPFTSISRTEKTESKSGYTHRKSVKKKEQNRSLFG